MNKLLHNYSKKLLGILLLATIIAIPILNAPVNITEATDDEWLSETGRWTPYTVDFTGSGPFIADDEQYSAILPSNINSGDGVRFYCQGHYFAYKLSGGKMQWWYIDKDKEETKSIGAILSSQGTSSGNNVTYPNAFWETDVRYTAHSYGLREVFTLDTLPSGASVDWDETYLEYTGELNWDDGLSVWADGVEHPNKTFRTSGNIDFRDITTGESVFYIPAPTAWDSEGNTCNLVYDVKVSAEKVQYGLRVPYDFLATAVFPVYIDPDNWVSPTGHNDPSSVWSNESFAYDDDTGTYAGSTSEVGYLELTIPAIVCDKVRIYADDYLGANPAINLDVYYGSDWHNIFSGTIAKSKWVTKGIGSTQIVTKASVRFNNDYPHRLYEFDFNSLPPVVETDPCTDVKSTSLDANGDIKAGSPVTTRGFHYSKVYDDFEWGSDADPLSDDGGAIDWYMVANGNAKAEIDTAQHFSGTRSARFYSDGTYRPYAQFTQAAGEDYVIFSRLRKDTDASIRIFHGNGSKRLFVSIHDDEKVYYHDSSAHDTGATVSVDTWFTLQIENIDWTAGTYDIYLDGLLIQSGAAMLSPSTYTTDRVRFQNYILATSEMWLDEVALWYIEDEDGSFSEGEYSLEITELDPVTTYYIQAFAKNSVGYGYGDIEEQLTCPAAPTNVAATDGNHTDKVVITWTKSTGATGYKVYEGDNLLDTLGDVATYDDTSAPAPTITPGTATASDGDSTAHVTLSLAGESANNGTSRTYKVVAFNDAGDSPDSGTDTGYRGVGALTYQWYRSSGDSDADYSILEGATTENYEDTTAPAPTITPGNADASDGTSTAHVTLTLSGHTGNNGAGRYYQCVLNAEGAAQQTSASNRGYRGADTLTYQWLRSAADSDADYSNIEGATTNPYNDTNGVTEPDGRYYLSTVNMPGAASQNSTADRGYKLIITAPNVTAYDATGITGISGTVHGEITDTGNENPDTVGFEWGYSAGNYTYNWTDAGDFGLESFSHTISGLSVNTTVFWRAFAINSGGTGYSAALNFTTLALPLAPTNFKITQVGYNSYNISWTMGIAADTTIVRVRETEYPESATAGIPVYSGNSTWLIVSGLDPNMTTYYYRAWSENDFGYSLDYAEASLGNEMGVAQLIFVIGLCGFALWKRGWVRVLLSVCVIMWGAFAMPYDMKIAAPLVALGIILFVIGIMNIMHGGEKWSSAIPSAYHR